MYEVTDHEPSDFIDTSQPELWEIFLDLFKPTELKSFGSYICGTVSASHPDTDMESHLESMEKAGNSKPKLVDAVRSLLEDVIDIELNAL